MYCSRQRYGIYHICANMPQQKRHNISVNFFGARGAELRQDKKIAGGLPAT